MTAVCAADRRFDTTRWSMVLAAADDDSGVARAALSELCEAYWYPLYAFARRRGAASAEAEDLTQGFFAMLLAKDYVRDADRTRGRFRTFLLAAFRHHCSKEFDKAKALKRGGGARVLSIDYAAGDARYALEPVENLTPEHLYAKRFALTILDRTLARVREAEAARGRSADFAVLQPFLAPGTGRPTYEEAAARLGLSDSALKSAVRRLRLRYRDALRAEIAETVPSAADVDAEIRELMEILGS